MVYTYVPHAIYVSIVSEFISSVQGEQDEVGVGAPAPSRVSVVTSQQFLCGPIHARYPPVAGVRGDGIQRILAHPLSLMITAIENANLDCSGK
jgi:hypothetical protein